MTAHGMSAVLLDLDRPRPSVLDRVAKAMKATDAGVPAVGEHQPARDAHADHLVIHKIGRHPDQLELTPALADDLVAGLERDQVREALERDRVAVADDRLDGVGEGHHLGHDRPPSLRVARLSLPCSQ
jgi:hypothetical protein